MSEVSKEIAERIKTLRLEKHLKQSEFAELLSIKQSYLSAIESAKKPVTFGLLNKLANKLSVTTDWVFFGKEPKYVSNEERAKNGDINDGNIQREVWNMPNTNISNSNNSRSAPENRLNLINRGVHIYLSENEINTQVIEYERELQFYYQKMVDLGIISVHFPAFDYSSILSQPEEKRFAEIAWSKRQDYFIDHGIQYYESLSLEERLNYITELKNKLQLVKDKFFELFHKLFQASIAKIEDRDMSEGEPATK